MRIRVRKMVYLPIGGALAAGLLVSAFVEPQAQLAASQNCYGVCGSTTTLSLSRSTVTVGHEALAEFRVTVKADSSRSRVPTGSVEVKHGTKNLCHINLSHGKGHCSLGEKELHAGSYEVDAHYSGDANLDPSISGSRHLEVVRDSSKAELSLSRSTVTDGRESEEEFHVTVKAGAPSPGEPTGSVEVKDGSRDLCRINLSRAEGHCRLAERELKPGSYEIEAHYSGNADVDSSTSERKHLEVRRG
jgi:hypothetical protein